VLSENYGIATLIFKKKYFGITNIRKYLINYQSEHGENVNIKILFDSVSV
jgi:hypothetical protein